MRSDPARPCTKTQGSIIALSERPDGVHSALVTCNPAPVESRRALNRREHLVCRMSTDGGKTWPRSLVVEPASAGYSTLLEIDSERIAVAYDRHPRMSFRTFYREDLRLEGLVLPTKTCPHFNGQILATFSPSIIFFSSSVRKSKPLRTRASSSLRLSQLCLVRC